MLSIAHTLISLPLGVYLEHPFLIFSAATALHLFSDTILHWNIFPKKFKRYPFGLVGLDVIGGLLMAWTIMGNNFFTMPILAAIIGGNMPDVIHGLWDFMSRRTQNRYFFWIKPAFIFHDKIQLETTNVPAGLAWQITLGALAFLLVV